MVASVTYLSDFGPTHVTRNLPVCLVYASQDLFARDLILIEYELQDNLLLWDFTRTKCRVYNSHSNIFYQLRRLDEPCA